MQKVLMSLCFMGKKVRYDGVAKSLMDDPIVKAWIEEERVVSICPEVSGGLPVPRPPAEMRDGCVFDINGKDVTSEFQSGAEKTLALAQKHGIKLAVLKESSPSCGSRTIYDGTHSGNKIPGEGITTALLREHGITVFSENELEQADAFLRDL